MNSTGHEGITYLGLKFPRNITHTFCIKTFRKDLIRVPEYPPDPVDGGTHARRMGVSMTQNPFRNVEDEISLTKLRSVDCVNFFNHTVFSSQTYYGDSHRLIRQNQEWLNHMWFMCTIICARLGKSLSTLDLSCSISY